LRLILDVPNFQQWVDSTLAEGSSAPQNPKRAYNLDRFVRAILRRNRTLSVCTEAILQRLGRLRFPLKSSGYLFRLAVLSLALQEYERN
jgi:hypothetical protein